MRVSLEHFSDNLEEALNEEALELNHNITSLVFPTLLKWLRMETTGHSQQT